MAFGLYYVHDSWYVGASGQRHLNAPLIHLGDKNELQMNANLFDWWIQY